MNTEVSTHGVAPTWLTRSAWLLVLLGALGAVVLPAFNMHTSPPPAALFLLGAGCALWLSPVLLCLLIFYVLRGRRVDVRPSHSEWALTVILAAASAALIALSVIER